MKKLQFFIAKRYLFSRKSRSVINIISRVSAFAVGIPVAAMVILLSVFNGFEGLVKSLYNDFDPDIAVMPVEGKVFRSEDNISRELILGIEGVGQVSEVLEDNALLEYRGSQYIGMLKGVDRYYTDIVPMREMLVDGRYELMFGDMMQAVVGQGVAYHLGVRPALQEPVKVVVPRRSASFSSLIPVNIYKEGRVFPAGVFALDADTDGKYTIVPIEFTRELFDYPEGVSSYMVKAAAGYDHEKIRNVIAETLGKEVKVLTRYQQKASLYKIMTYEKWGIFAIALLVLVIASFSIIGCLVMIIIDKENDCRTMINMGAPVKFVRKVFINEGMLIALTGGAGGFILGVLFCLLQSVFGIIKIPADTFLVDSYPVILKAGDLIVVMVSFIAVSYIITKFTVLKMLPDSKIRI